MKARLQVTRGLSYGAACIALLLNIVVIDMFLGTASVPAPGREPHHSRTLENRGARTKGGPARTRTLWSPGPHVVLDLPVGTIAVVDPLIAVALCVLAGLGMGKELILRGSPLALALNIGHLMLCAVVVYTGFGVIYRPLEIMLG